MNGSDSIIKERSGTSDCDPANHWCDSGPSMRPDETEPDGMI